MFAFIKGKIDSVQNGSVFVDVSGVGYQIFMTSNSVFKNGEVRKFYLHEHIREDSHDLYGFISLPDLHLFEKLISVSGVGPKVGLAIMSQGDSDKIVLAIESSDLTFFTSISGVGKKVAAKIILELKNKISADESSNILNQSENSDDAIEALMSLGYKRPEIAKLLSKVPADKIETEEKVKWLLKHLAK